MTVRTQYAISIAFGAVVIVGLLAADGLFSRTRTLRHPLTGATSQLSDFGPPSRTAPPETVDGAVMRKVVAEPLYVDARIPVFFDAVSVDLRLRGNMIDASGIRIGVEAPDGGIAFLPTSSEGIPAHDRTPMQTVVHARARLRDLPMSGGRRFRFVLALPGVTPEAPLEIESFDVRATRGGLAIAN